MKDVHDLRTRARRLETIIAAYMPDTQKRNRRLLKTLKPVCKAAGAVRDMDVLTAKARALAGRRHDDSLALLLEHLQAMRIESAAKLFESVARHGKDACRSLKDYSNQIEGRFKRKDSRRAAKTTGNQLHANAANKLMDELSRWPTLNAENLHAFRIKVKKLRIVLQLAEDANPDFTDALEKVKEQIGDWHDWQELKKIAEAVLDPRKDHTVLEEIEEMERRMFKQALTCAQTMRRVYLGAYSGFTIAEP